MPVRPLILLACLCLSACSSYYGQLARGQWQLWQQQQDIEQLIEDDSLDPRLRQRLELVRDARSFAHTQLALPDNGSYRQFVELNRPYVVWNLFATDEFSIEAKPHCFPIAGCVAYRGYFDQNRARGAAALLRQQGMDVAIAGVEAYSTLGWLNDPLLSSMLRRNDEQLVGVIFHELAHQRYYLAGDTAFNESFASFVEQQGLRQWNPWYELRPKELDEHRRVFTELLLKTRAELAELYRQDLAEAQMRQAKEQIFTQLRADYRALQASRWPHDTRYQAWINAPLNNAKLLPFGLYDQWVPAFAQLYQQNPSWPEFYLAVEQLGALPAEQRLEKLSELTLRAETAKTKKPEL